MELSEKILLRSADLFRRYGMRSITMDEIATQCGISKKTLYQHFTDKENLVCCVVEKMIHQSESQCLVDSGRAENAVHEVFLSMDMVRQMFEGINPAMLFDLQKYHSDANSKLEGHKHEFISRQVKANLERGIAEGLYRPDLHIGIITHLHMHIINAMFLTEEIAQLKVSLHEWQTQMMLHYIYGIATPRGVKLIEKYKKQRINQK